MVQGKYFLFAWPILTLHGRRQMNSLWSGSGFFKNRINLSIDAYYSVTRALLFEQPTQSFTGYSYYWNNIGKVRNSGVEIQIDTHNIKNRKFSWVQI